MNHADHVSLLREGVGEPGGVWADFGSGRGAFTLALAELIGPAGQIISVDRDREGLRAQEMAFREWAPERRPKLLFVQADFSRKIDLPPLEGIVMANALHFFRDKEGVLQRVRACLKPGGRLILVEYNVDRGNLWVPYPLSYPSWEALAGRAGLIHTRRLAIRPSRFLGEIYSALSEEPSTPRQ